MFDKALVALDLSPAGQSLLARLPDLQDWGVQHLVLAHVIQAGFGQGAGLARQQEYMDGLEQQAAPLRAAGFSVRTSISAGGAPADGILALGHQSAADLIVIGSRGQNLLGRLFLGSVARDVLRQTTAPVLLEWLEPTGEAADGQGDAAPARTLDHLIFATDFSPQAAAAECALLELAMKARQVECVHVLPPGQDGQNREQAAQAQTGLARLVGRIRALGRNVTGTLLQGAAAEEIARHATGRNASLILVGKHGQNRVASRLIGSTAARLCETAGRPVLMVP
ncbi:MAG: universal stress protein [Gammaproteobacteria bacterium]|nr:universal stress protein [Gammaproteobacteria bacterium]